VGIAYFFKPSVAIGFGVVTLLWATLLMPVWMIWGAFQLAKKAAFDANITVQMKPISEFPY